MKWMINIIFWKFSPMLSPCYHNYNTCITLYTNLYLSLFFSFFSITISWAHVPTSKNQQEKKIYQKTENTWKQRYMQSYMTTKRSHRRGWFMPVDWISYLWTSFSFLGYLLFTLIRWSFSVFSTFLLPPVKLGFCSL